MTPEERFTKIENLLHTVTESQVQNEMQIEKNTAGIRDLITISRTLLEAQSRTESSMKTLADTMLEHEGKMEALIDTVDRIIRSKEKE